MTDKELCEKCGEAIYHRYHPALRMCARHAREHLAALPPFACTSEDFSARDPENDPRCEECDHPWSRHAFDGCTQLTARFVTSYGKVMEDTGPYVCGCRAVDPLCQVLPPKAPVTSLGTRRPPRERP